MNITFRILLFMLALLPFAHVNAQTDCPDAIIVCGNANYSGLNATGIGTQEINFQNACSSQEHNSLWLKILIKDGGTLGFILTPESDDLVVDFDFWMYGPNVTCGALGTAIRCSTTNPGAAGLDFNHTGMNETETDVSEGPSEDGNAYINWITAADDDTYYLIIDRPHGSANFSLQWTGTATFHEVPVFLNPDAIALDITECDDDGVDDGKTTFDLTEFEAMFIGPQTDVALTYHLDNNGMLTGEDALDNPEAYINTSGQQTIYMRMTNTVTGCYDTEILTLFIDHELASGEPQALVLCDVDENGFRQFDLTGNDDDISNGTAGTTVTYYASQEAAENQTTPLPASYQNQQPYVTETIWARAENSADCFRYSITSFTITVLPLPEMLRTDDFPANVPLTIVECDDDGVDDNATTIDLTVFGAMLTGAQTDVMLSYHTESNDMETGDDPIDNPQAYTNTSNPQTIYLRMANTVTGCYTTETLTISIDHSLPVGVPETLELCDSDGDGIGEFDLSQNNGPITNGAANTSVTYYASQEDAENKVSPLPLLYLNPENSPLQTIWARLETTSGCIRYGFTSFTINVYPVPEMLRNDDFPAPDPLALVKCDGDGTDDGFTNFDLTAFAGMLMGTQPGVALTYYLDYNDALNGTDPVDNPASYLNTSSPQTLFLRMTYTATGCFVTETLTISTDTDLLTGIPEPLALCDDAGTGIAQFNLAQNDEAIINGAPNTAVTYYATAQDAENEINPLPALYQNQQPYITQVIWARLETTEGCFRYGITSFTITVNTVPEMLHSGEFPTGVPLEIAQCDDDGVNDGSVAFDLTAYEEMLMGTQAGVAITYHLTAGDQLTGDNAVDNPLAFANTSNPQTIYLRMGNTTTGCYDTDTLVLTIDYQLETGVPDDLRLCDLEHTGLAQFDLTQNNGLIKNGNSNSTVTYYASEADALNQVNPLPDSYQNQVPYITETIWARLDNITGCFGYGITSFTIGILAMPEIEFMVDVVDFTQSSNSITIAMPNDDLASYEYSVDGTPYTDSTVYDGLPPGLYTVSIRSKDGCRTTSRDVPILNYPKFFTPNGDGTNEVWNVIFIYFFPDAIVNIFDRYGKLIKSYRGKEPGWDGTYNGERLPSTDYWFELVFASGRTIKGHFAMIR